MRTVIGLFDEYQEAQNAIDSLRSSGFDDITVAQDNDSSTAQSLMQQAYIPEQDSRFYLEGLRDGGTLVIVRTEDNRSREAVDILSRFNMVDLDTRLTEYQRSGRQNVGLSQLDEDGVVIPIVEEDIQVGKRQVQRGGVRVHTHISERPIEENVSLREEHVHVERRPVNRAATDADFTTFKEGTFELTETAEEAVVAKQARVIEEVVVGKESSERTETIRDTVRRTDVDVEEVNTGTRAVGQTTGFESYNSDFQSYYNSNLTNSGYTYEQYSPVFRYGYGLANDERYHGRQWNDIETTARTDWEAKNPGTWEQFKDSVQYAWQRATGKRS